eukprot:Sspe_Gene.45100::Locus_22241_Transcript_1_1_Confidence_1.000_Length_609::g.45100::m.45100
MWEVLCGAGCTAATSTVASGWDEWGVPTEDVVLGGEGDRLRCVAMVRCTGERIGEILVSWTVVMGMPRQLGGAKPGVARRLGFGGERGGGGGKGVGESFGD